MLYCQPNISLSPKRMNLTSSTYAAESLIHTKLAPPRLPSNWVERPEVMSRLQYIPRRRLTLVVSPAGSGKSASLAAWAGQTRVAAAWLSLDEYDGDSGVFLRYLLAALRRAHPSLARHTGTLPKANTSADALLGLFIEEAAAFTQALVVILDDYHHLINTPADKVVYRLLEYAPDNVHFVFGTRRRPAFALAKLHAAGALLEIREAELALSPVETGCMVRQWKPETPDAAVDQIYRATEGWVLGTLLMAQVLRDSSEVHKVPASALNAGARHPMLMQFLGEQVLQQESSAVRHFLAMTAPLHRFCAALCQAVLGEGFDAAALLAEIERRHLFVIRIDDEGRWYRYHPQFRDYLLHHPGQSVDVASIYERAWAWCEAHGTPEETLLYAQTRPEAIAETLVRRGRQWVWQRGEWALVEKVIGQLPESLCNQNIQISLLRASIAAQQWLFDECNRYLQQARRLMQEQVIPPAQRAVLEAEYDALALLLPAARMTPEELALLQAQLENIARTQSPQLYSLALMRYADKCFLTGDFEQCKTMYWRAIRTVQSEPNAQVVLNCYGTLANLCRDTGDLRGAFSILGEASDYVERWQVAPAAAVEIYLWLGVLHAETGALEAAAEQLTLVQHHAVQQPYIVNACFQLARVRYLQGRFEDASAALRDARDIIRRHNLPYLMGAVERMEVWLHIRQGDARPVHRWLARMNPLLNSETARQQPSPKDEINLLTAAHALLFTGAFSQCHAVLNDVERSLRARGRRVHLARAQMLRACAFHQQGQHTEALDTLEEAVAIALEGGLVLSLADVGAPAFTLLSLYAKQHNAPDDMRALLSAAQMPHGRASEKTLLSQREMEILRLLAIGTPNQEMAQRLYVSESTIKTHLKRMYRKLGAANRSQAVALSRRLGLL
jgi:LuxR family maltose regulon positive regulatory protein